MIARSFVAVLMPGTSRAHIAYETHDTPDADGDYDETWRGAKSPTLCGEVFGDAAKVGGTHAAYCQTCVAKLGAREITP